MRFRLTYFFWILMLAFGLMALVAAAQVLKKRSIHELQVGNKEAVLTFTINNRLQELVNLSFDLNSKVINRTRTKTQQQPLIDSLNMLGYNSSVLQKLNHSENSAENFQRLDELISLQVEQSMTVLNAENSAKSLDSLQKLKITDKVYSTALELQKKLENNLQATLNANTERSTFLSAYDKALAFIAIAAVLILCTIIINRHLRQVQLIKQLEAATDAAKQSASIKDQFLANMSHEIRTPLNAIKGFSHLLTQTNLADEQQKYASIINESSSNLLLIVNDILDISKMEAGKLRINNKEFDINKLLHTTEQMFGRSAQEKGLDYYQEMATGIPSKLWGDPDRLLQILINLISNGIKFTTHGYVKLSVNIVESSANNIKLEFLVQDTGIGIPQEKKGEVFNRFEQLQTGKDAILQGTGLGLSIVKNLITLMGGDIELESELERGSTFRVVLPFTLKHEAALVAAVEVINNQKIFANARVLVAEDNNVNQLLIISLLDRYQMTVDVVENGEAAIKSVSNKEYDLILMDIQMPVMDGYDTTLLLREKLNFTKPIVAMTAFVLPGEIEKCFTAGMDGYLAKPIDTAQLDSVLNMFLANKEGTQIRNQIPGNRLNFILKLSGGDNVMAGRIIKQIQMEIPAVQKKLSEIRSSHTKEELSALLHSMVSTFSPLGNDTQIIKAIENARSQLVKSETDIATIVDTCLLSMKDLNVETDEMLMSLSNN